MPSLLFVVMWQFLCRGNMITEPLSNNGRLAPTPLLRLSGVMSHNNDQIKVYETGMAFSTNGMEEKFKQNFCIKDGRRPLGRPYM
jgi:hypothetical protein